MNATDSFGNSATPEAIDVTVAAPPVITASSPQTVGVGKAGAIAVSLSEANATSTETFTVTLTDTTGDLSASGCVVGQRLERSDHRQCLAEPVE